MINMYQDKDETYISVAETTLRLQSKNLMKSMLYIFLKIINHSRGQKPTKEAYLGHMYEP